MFVHSIHSRCELLLFELTYYQVTLWCYLLWLFPFHYSAPSSGAEYCDEHVCLSVCPWAYLQNYAPNVPQFLCTLPMSAALCSCSAGAAVHCVKYTMYRHVYTQRSGTGDGIKAYVRLAQRRAAWIWQRGIYSSGPMRRQHGTGGGVWYPRLPCSMSFLLHCSHDYWSSVCLCSTAVRFRSENCDCWMRFCTVDGFYFCWRKNTVHYSIGIIEEDSYLRGCCRTVSFASLFAGLLFFHSSTMQVAAILWRSCRNDVLAENWVKN